jgi:hypothetical protein
MKLFKDILKESYQTFLFQRYGYQGPFKGADHHVTFKKDDDMSGSHPEFLIDLPGNEWHFMLKDIVVVVGKMDNTSLKDFLEGKPNAEVEEQVSTWQELSDLAQERLAKQRIYEPEYNNVSGDVTSS